MYVQKTLEWDLLRSDDDAVNLPLNGQPLAMILFLTRMASSSSPGSRVLTRLRASGFRLKSTTPPESEAAPKKYSGPSIKFSPTGGATRMNEPKEGAFNSTGNPTG